MTTKKEYLTPSTRLQALIGTLPFLAFGFFGMISEMNGLFPIRGQVIEMVVYGLCLVGLLIGWIRGFPRWSYSYLGWSFLIAYFNTKWGYYSDPDFQIWIPFGITVLIAILWTHSFAPIKKLFQGIWHDWTRLTLAMFTFGGFAWMVAAYDENHHPQLLWFMLAATLATSAGVWFFFRSASLKGRVLSLLGGLFVADMISLICSATWDYREYYGLPESTQTWYESLSIYFRIHLFWLALLFWPAVIGFLHYVINQYKGLANNKGVIDG